jgi:hypothetical protein
VAADLPDAIWDRLGAARDRFTGARRAPDDSTLGRVLAGIDADALDAAVCRWLIGRAGAGGPGPRVIAVDGKTLRGSGPAGAQVHLLAAVDHRDGIVLAQTHVDGKTNELFRSRATSRMVGKCGLARSTRTLTMSGRLMIEALVAGERDPHALADPAPSWMTPAQGKPV